jgi:NAD(P)-dependent dehydrogenase (short-subunit alcohol dehydrogenase family)
MTGRLEGQVALVTGAASGVGEATARLFARDGARVVLADIQDELGSAVAKEIGEDARYRHCDVREEAQVESAIQTALEEFRRLDCVFANAGVVGALGSIAELPSSDWEYTMAVNLRGPYLCMKHAARVMKQQRSGSIIATASVAALQGGLAPHTYGASKAGLIGLVRSVAAELAPFGVRVNCIAAGNLATEMVAGMIFGDPSKVSEIQQGLAAESPLPGRAGLPGDIARAALYLASEDAGFVTGHTLVVDAGITTGTGWKMAGLYEGHAPVVREAGRRGLPDE